jgi:hypothetical protein
VTIAEWLHTRVPEPPSPLGRRVCAALASELTRDAQELPEVALDAAVAVLEALLRREGAGRDQALELLAVDALVTYAFEAAADAPETVTARADRAMRRLAELVEGTHA